MTVNLVLVCLANQGGIPTNQLRSIIFEKLHMDYLTRYSDNTVEHMLIVPLFLIIGYVLICGHFVMFKSVVFEFKLSLNNALLTLLCKVQK